MDNNVSASFIMEHLFPLGTFDASRFDSLQHEGRFRRLEINGLSKHTYPLGSHIILSGLEKNSRNERREHMLIEAFDQYIHLRICAAMEGSGYDEFVVIHNMAPVNSEAGKELHDYAIQSITSICKEITINNSDVVPATTLSM